MVGSVLCGTGPQPAGRWSLFRVLQGFGAGALQPTEQAILRQTFPPQEQGMAMALFGMAVMIGPAIGPTLGGYIVDNYRWSVDLLHQPAGRRARPASWSGASCTSRRTSGAANRRAAAEQRSNFDWQGIALLVRRARRAAVRARGGRSATTGSSRATITALRLRRPCSRLAAFVIRELTAPVPAVNLRLFKDPVFTSGTLIGAVMFAMLMASMFLLPLFMQELLGFTATQSGLALMPRTLVMMVVTPIVGRLYNRVSPRVLVAVGILCAALGAWQQSHFTLQTTAAGVVGTLLVQGVGFACLFVPLTTAALSNIPRQRLTDATGLNSLLRQIGGSVGLAIFATLLTRCARLARHDLVSHLAPERPEVLARLGAMTSAFLARGTTR